MVRVEDDPSVCRLPIHSPVFAQPALPVTPILYPWYSITEVGGSAIPSSAASLATVPSEYVLALSCPVQKPSAIKRNLNIQFYCAINDKFPKSDNGVTVIWRLLLCLGYIHKYLGVIMVSATTLKWFSQKIMYRKGGRVGRR